MRMGELKRGGWGQNFLPKNDMDECDKGRRDESNGIGLK
jgi:hypothetical protein